MYQAKFKVDDTRVPWTGPHTFEITSIGDYTIYSGKIFYQDLTYHTTENTFFENDPDVSFSPITWEVSDCINNPKVSRDTFSAPGPAPTRTVRARTELSHGGNPQCLSSLGREAVRAIAGFVSSPPRARIHRAGAGEAEGSLTGTTFSSGSWAKEIAEHSPVRLRI